MARIILALFSAPRAPPSRYQRSRLRHSVGDKKALWGRYATYSLVSGILSIILLPVFILGLPGPSLIGVSERVFLAVPFVWIEVMAVALYRSESKVYRLGP